MKVFTNYRQLDSMDCGPTCLRMIAKHYGKSYSLPFLREKCYIDKAGVSLKGISEAETIGLKTLAVHIPLTDKKDEPSLKEAPLPCIAHWNQNHFVVVYKTSRSHIWIADPANGKHKLTNQEFKNSWLPDNKENGIALLIEPTNPFFQSEHEDDQQKGFGFLVNYLKPHRRLMVQVLLVLSKVATISRLPKISSDNTQYTIL